MKLQALPSRSALVAAATGALLCACTEADKCPLDASTAPDSAHAVCDDASFTQANWAGASLRDARMNRVDLSGADLSSVRIERSDFEQATLTAANLDGALFSAARFVEADLSGTSLVNAYMRASDFTGATLDGATFAADPLAISGQFLRTSFYGASLRNTQITLALFVAADFRSADFTGASVICADFSNSRLNGADFTNASLLGTYIGRDKPENVSGVIWSNTICPDGSNSDDNGGTCVGHLDYDPQAVECPIAG